MTIIQTPQRRIVEDYNFHISLLHSSLVTQLINSKELNLDDLQNEELSAYVCRIEFKSLEAV
jgi:hypothetical protein